MPVNRKNPNASLRRLRKAIRAVEGGQAFEVREKN